MRDAYVLIEILLLTRRNAIAQSLVVDGLECHAQNVLCLPNGLMSVNPPPNGHHENSLAPVMSCIMRPRLPCFTSVS